MKSSGPRRYSAKKKSKASPTQPVQAESDDQADAIPAPATPVGGLSKKTAKKTLAKKKAVAKKAAAVNEGKANKKAWAKKKSKKKRAAARAAKVDRIKRRRRQEAWDRLMSWCGPFEPEELADQEETSRRRRGDRQPATELAAEMERRFGRVRSVGAVLERYQGESGLWVPVSEAQVFRELEDLLGADVTPRTTEEVLKVMVWKYEAPLDRCASDAETINLREYVLYPLTGEVVPFDHALNHRIKVDCDYQEAAECPLWLKTLDEIFENDSERIALLQEIMGYCLTDLCHLQCFFLFIGSGANGKGVITRVLTELVGKENVCNLALERFTNQFLLGSLRGKKVNIVPEVDTSRPIPTSELKALTGADMITVDVKYKDPVTFKPTAKHLLLVNEMPRFRDTSHGLQRRTVILEFKRTFTPEQRNPKLVSQLRGEAPGIMRWAVEGLQRLMERGRLTEPESVKVAREAFQAMQNPLKTFADEVLEFGQYLSAPRPELYSYYEDWHERNNVRGRPMSRTELYSALRCQHPQLIEKRINGRDLFEGVRISTKAERERDDRHEERSAEMRWGAGVSRDS